MKRVANLFNPIAAHANADPQRARQPFSPRSLRRSLRRGATLAIALATLLAVTLVAAAVVRSSLAAHRQAQMLQHELQAQWLAECAVQRAAARLASDAGYEGETWQPVVGGPQAVAAADDQTTAAAARGVAVIKVLREADDARAGEANQARVEVQAHYPDHEWRRVAVRRTYHLSISTRAESRAEPGAAQE